VGSTLAQIGNLLAMNVFWFVEKPVGFGLGPFEPMGQLLL